MTEDVQPAKRPVSPALSGPHGHPFHPILVTVPIGTWVASLVFDIASYLVGTPGTLIQGSLWLIAIGVIGALIAATTGFLDLLTIPAGTATLRTGLVHMVLNLAVTGAYAGNFAWRYADTSRPGAVPLGPLLLSAVSLVALAVSGYLGGTLVYRYGVRVAEEPIQAEGRTRHAR